MFLTTWFVSNLLLAALVLQLARRQLYFELPFFFACTVFRLFQAAVLSVALSWFQFLSTAYMVTWFLTESIAILLVALVSAECYAWLTRRIFGLGPIGAGALGLAAMVAVAVMTGTSLDSADDLSLNLAYQLRFKQFMMGFLAISLALLLGFYQRFPLFAPRQAWRHAFIQLVYLATHTLGYRAVMSGGMASTPKINEVLSITWIACLIAWLWIFRKGVTWPPSLGDDSLKRADEQAERLERLV